MIWWKFYWFFSNDLFYRDARTVPLVYPTAISISPLDGALYIAESDGSKLHQIRRIDVFRFEIFHFQMSKNMAPQATLVRFSRNKRN